MSVRFGPFHLDTENACVWRGSEALHLTPKAFAVLNILLAHPGRLVTKDELWQAVWPGIAVTDAALTVCMKLTRFRGARQAFNGGFSDAQDASALFT
jgi:DNA-binding winged helix-turn-helix (wHTH) protein